MDNAAIVDRLDTEGFGRGNVDVVDEVVAEDFVDHQAMPGMSPDREGLKTLIRALHQAFPDMQMQIEDRIVAGDKVVERWSCTGTHDGEFMGLPPTHRRIEIRGMDISRLEDGRLVEHWTQVDMLSMLQQLGALPTQAQAPA
jgi:steroid delta-isomerase-like uncharacterized protein